MVCLGVSKTTVAAIGNTGGGLIPIHAGRGGATSVVDEMRHAARAIIAGRNTY